MTERSVGLASLAGLVLIGAFWLGRTSAPVGSAVLSPPASEITAPTHPAVQDADGAGIEALRTRNRELAAQVAWFQAQLDLLKWDTASPRSAAGVAPAASTSGGAQSANSKTKSDFDASEFLVTGVPPSEVKRLRSLYDKFEMERNGITQRALREGWLDTPRFQDEMVEIDLATREAIGDEAYDEILYATGRQNRVMIRVLLEHSADRSFGLQQGDVVLSYDGHLVFSPVELRDLSLRGEPGEWVPVDVLRNGEVVRLGGQRGRIGARLQPTRILPESLW